MTYLVSAIQLCFIVSLLRFCNGYSVDLLKLLGYDDLNAFERASCDVAYKKEIVVSGRFVDENGWPPVFPANRSHLLTHGSRNTDLEITKGYMALLEDDTFTKDDLIGVEQLIDHTPYAKMGSNLINGVFCISGLAMDGYGAWSFPEPYLEYKEEDGRCYYQSDNLDDLLRKAIENQDPITKDYPDRWNCQRGNDGNGPFKVGRSSVPTIDVGIIYKQPEIVGRTIFNIGACHSPACFRKNNFCFVGPCAQERL